MTLSSHSLHHSCYTQGVARVGVTPFPFLYITHHSSIFIVKPKVKSFDVFASSCQTALIFPRRKSFFAQFFSDCSVIVTLIAVWSSHVKPLTLPPSGETDGRWWNFSCDTFFLFARTDECIQMFIVQWMDGWMITLIHGLFARRNIFGPVQRTIRAVSQTSGCFRLSLRPRLQALLYAKSTMCTCLLDSILQKSQCVPDCLLTRSYLAKSTICSC